MLKINHIASGSKGNAIVVDDGVTKLLFDAGLSYKQLSRRVRFSEITATLVTHEHGDHIKAVPKLLERGRVVYMSKGTSEACNLKTSGLPIKFLKHGEQVQIGSFRLLPFNVVHDAKEPLGFLFESTTTGVKGTYISDTCELNYSFTGVTHWIIECNYSQDILNSSESIPDWLKDRIRNSHMSFENIKEFFQEADLSKTTEIHLIHLSDRNSDEKRFVDELQRTTGVPVYT